MRKVFLMLAVSVIALSFSGTRSTKERQIPNFQGEWGWIRNATSNRYNFHLTITQSGTIIKGYHSIVALAGNKIDCGGDPDSGDDPSITGKIENGIATVTFDSSFMRPGDEEGRASLKFVAPNKIEWKIIKDTGGENYFPDKAILVRE